MFTGKLTVPFSHPQCLDRFSFFSKHLSRWIFMDTQQRKREAKIQAQLNGGYLHYERVRKTAKLERPTRLTTLTHKPYKYSYISPELMNLLKRYEMPNAPNRTRQQPASVLPVQQKSKHTRAKYIDEVNPIMARYMRQVMEENNIQNCLYDINFYGPHIATKLHEPEDPLVILRCLDYELVAALLKKQKHFGILTKHEEAMLLRALQALSEFSAQQLTTYFAILHAEGVTNRKVLQYLEQLTDRLNFETWQRELLRNTIGILQEATLKRASMSRRLRTDQIDYEIRQQSQIMRQMRMTEMNESLIYFKESFLVPQQSERTTIVETKEEKPFQGRKKSGYYEPLDVPLPWKEFQADFQKLLQYRMNRIKLETFPYRRGLERYYYDWKRQRDEQRLQREEAEKEAKLLEEKLMKQKLMEARKKLRHHLMAKPKSQIARSPRLSVTLSSRSRRNT